MQGCGHSRSALDRPPGPQPALLPSNDDIPSPSHCDENFALSHSPAPPRGCMLPPILWTTISGSPRGFSQSGAASGPKNEALAKKFGGLTPFDTPSFSVSLPFRPIRATARAEDHWGGCPPWPRDLPRVPPSHGHRQRPPDAGNGDVDGPPAASRSLTSACNDRPNRQAAAAEP